MRRPLAGAVALVLATTAAAAADARDVTVARRIARLKHERVAGGLPAYQPLASVA